MPFLLFISRNLDILSGILGGDFFQLFHQLANPLVVEWGRDDRHLHELISVYSLSRHRRSFASEPKFLSGLCAGGYADHGRALQSRDFDLRSQRRLRYGYRNRKIDVSSFPAEQRMFFHFNRDKKISRCRTVRACIALTGDPHLGSGVYPPRDLYIDMLGFWNNALTPASTALFAARHPASTASSTGRSEFHGADLTLCLSPPPAIGTSLLPAALNISMSLAGTAGDQAGELDPGLYALDGILETDAHAVVKIVAALRSRLLSPAGSKHIPEKIPER